MSKPLPSVLECARLYLAPGSDSFWRWSDDQEAIEWLDGGTLLLRQELVALFDVRLMADRGMPPLDQVVLLAAALRDRARAQAALYAMPAPADSLPGRWPPLLPDLDAVWQRLRHQPTARTMLYDWLLREKPASVSFTQRVRDALGQPLPAAVLQPNDRPRLPLARFVDSLAHSSTGLCAGRIELLAGLGLEELPQPAALELPIAGGAPRLLEALADDGPLQEFAQVVRNVAAAFRLPRRLDRPEQIAQGGTASIGNRGPLDRLLLAELAHDDEVLAVRVATNQALYVEPELPPVHHRPRRHVLLDCGVSTWGSTRVLGVAVGMALACDPNAGGGDVVVQTCHQGRLVPVDLTTREGLVEQLERLDDTLDVTQVLDTWCTASAEHTSESVVVLARRSLDSPAIRTRLAADAARRFVVDIAADEQGGGTARLWQVRPRGLQLLREARLQAPAIQPSETLPGSPLPLPTGLGALPACLRTHRDASPPLKTVWLGGSTLSVVTHRDQRLEVRCVARGIVSLVQPVSSAAPSGRPWPLLPLPQPPETPPLQMVTVADKVHVYWDGRVMHFVGRSPNWREFAILLGRDLECIGWCYREQRELRGDDLLARLRQLSEDLS